MAAVHPHTMAIISTSAFREVIGVVRLWHFVVWINYNLENVIPGFQIGNVDPLAVDVMPVGIPATHSNTLVSKVGTFIPLFNTFITL